MNKTAGGTETDQQRKNYQPPTPLLGRIISTAEEIYQYIRTMYVHKNVTKYISIHNTAYIIIDLIDLCGVIFEEGVKGFSGL